MSRARECLMSTVELVTEFLQRRIWFWTNEILQIRSESFNQTRWRGRLPSANLTGSSTWTARVRWSSWTVSSSLCHVGVCAKPVFPTRPSLDGRLGKIARLTPVFLWFCPSICDFGHIHKRYWAVWQTGQQHFQRALNHKKTTKSLKLEFCPPLRPYFCPKSARLSPVFLQKWARLKNWEYCI